MMRSFSKLRKKLRNSLERRSEVTKCPICNLEIDHIVCETTEFYRHIVRLPKDEAEKDETEYDPDSNLMHVVIEDSTIVEDKYICPICRKEIFQDEGEILKFLKGGE